MRKFEKRTQGFAEFSRLLTQFITLLESHKVDHWPDALRTHVSSVEKGEVSGVRGVYGFFGGMGSLSDIFVNRERSDKAGSTTENESDVNREISVLRDALYERSKDLLGIQDFQVLKVRRPKSK